MMSEQINIIVADDHSLFRSGLVRMLNSIHDIQVVGEAADGDQALTLAQTVDADIITLDLNMPGMSDMVLIKEIKKLKPNMRILIISMHDEGFLVKQTLKNGANGYITKNCTADELESIVTTIKKNGRYISPDLANSLIFEEEATGSSSLTSREIQILRMITQSGMSLVEIAKNLKVSPKTVTSHKSNIMTKLNAKSNLDLIRKAQNILK
jgi:DNA-binding NarL/FixJ family response regulator